MAVEHNEGAIDGLMTLVREDLTTRRERIVVATMGRQRQIKRARLLCDFLIVIRQDME